MQRAKVKRQFGWNQRRDATQNKRANQAKQARWPYIREFRFAHAMIDQESRVTYKGGDIKEHMMT
jgi:hypothetical protein